MASANTQSLMGRGVDINFDEDTAVANRPLRKSGGSIVLTIPPDMLRALEWDRGDDVQIFADWERGEIRLQLADGGEE